jgi:Zn finger protein HypA/HybF involved in hydrogenase expression
MINLKNKCLRCEKAEAYTTKGFTSAWCPKCHFEKFGCKHGERTKINLHGTSIRAILGIPTIK